MSSKARVYAGDCGFINVIEVDSSNGKSLEINISSNCEKVSGMQNDLKEISWEQLFEEIFDSPVYRSANKNSLHSDCIVPACVLKVCKVELGFMLPKEAKMKFD